ncbi:cytosine/adenosine deaminase [Owenweeksia hongkongensis DSM 17368]|uniref:tRNA-specific adenosine deaminase n=1 Tax=Owenweeksia hongkongensis (strain DSM 17368 / CIP 108786 / JCM 12287 / NRRL B-23963 / UST20020801) TaxID=926562 RepID=G8R3M1_OWEHD|nr:nucleoside deaminase [Owenweeksia hongkongensis]AEV33077.1 cytosine/adenosine deaminase [Owenweeksia hongkongensis DSM 17368]
MEIEVYNDEYFMKQAMREAELAYAEDEVPVGAIITVNKKIIGRGHNLTERLVDVTAHAEIQAITAASGYLGAKYLKDCTLYVTLEPCPMCAGALFWSQIGRVVYAAKDEKRGFLAHGGRLHKTTVLEGGFMEKEASSLLKTYFASKRL